MNNSKSLLFGLFALLILSATTLVSAQQSINATLTHDGIERTYTVFIPEAYDSTNAIPLVFNFHGYGSNAGQQTFYANLAVEAAANNFLLVHPQGTQNAMGANFWNANWGAEVDDIGFTVAMIDALSDEYNVDSLRVYSTGMSNGGYMSYALACALSDRIAAIASVTGTMTAGQTDICETIRTVPIMQFHGTADPTVPYEGSQFGEGIDFVMEYWAEKNACGSDPEFIMIPDTDMADGSTAEHYIWSTEDNEALVELYKIIDGEHTWPGASFNNGVTNQDINASALIWEFFSKHSLPEAEEPMVNGLESNGSQNTDLLGALSFSPNPAVSFLNIDLGTIEFANVQISIFDNAGKRVLKTETQSQRSSLDVSTLAKGLYFVHCSSEREVEVRKLLID